MELNERMGASPQSPTQRGCRAGIERQSLLQPLWHGQQIFNAILHAIIPASSERHRRRPLPGDLRERPGTPKSKPRGRDRLITGDDPRLAAG